MQRQGLKALGKAKSRCAPETRIVRDPGAPALLPPDGGLAAKAVAVLQESPEWVKRCRRGAKELLSGHLKGLGAYIA